MEKGINIQNFISVSNKIIENVNNRFSARGKTEIITLNNKAAK